MNDHSITPAEAKRTLLRLSLSLPIFYIGDDHYNATCVSSIGISTGDTEEEDELYVLMAGTGMKDAIYYDFDTRDELIEAHTKAVNDWKAALKKLYE